VRLVQPAVAGRLLAAERKYGGFEIAGGQQDALESFLGPADRDDHMPGLGELAGWGVIDDERGFLGCIYTEFPPWPDQVSFMFSVRCKGDRLALDVLRLLLELPKGCLRTFSVTSLASGGVGLRAVDRGKLTFETRSKRAMDLYLDLTNHLVTNSAVTVSPEPLAVRDPLFVRVHPGDWLSSFHQNNQPPPTGHVHITDWED
jgi:hypothetical protein